MQSGWAVEHHPLCLHAMPALQLHHKPIYSLDAMILNTGKSQNAVCQEYLSGSAFVENGRLSLGGKKTSADLKLLHQHIC